MNKKAVYITFAKRAALGSLLGNLATSPASKLSAFLIEAIVKESGLNPSQVNKVIMGQMINWRYRTKSCSPSFDSSWLTAKSKRFYH